jgi:hypothetical protein
VHLLLACARFGCRFGFGALVGPAQKTNIASNRPPLSVQFAGFLALTTMSALACCLCLFHMRLFLPCVQFVACVRFACIRFPLAHVFASRGLFASVCLRFCITPVCVRFACVSFRLASVFLAPACCLRPFLLWVPWWGPLKKPTLHPTRGELTRGRKGREVFVVASSSYRTSSYS